MTTNAAAPEIDRSLPEERPKPPVKARWVILVAIVGLLLSMVLPAAFSLAMDLEFHAALKSVDEWGRGRPGVLGGSISETYKTTTMTDYSARFVPARLTMMALPMTVIEILYGPLAITGAPLELAPSPVADDKAFSGEASLGFASAAGPVFFFVCLIVLLLIVDVALKDPYSVMKFVLGLTIVWLVYAVILWAAGNWITQPIDGAINELLTEKQGEADFAPTWLNAVAAPGRLFLAAMIYWVLSFTTRRSRTREPQLPQPSEAAQGA